MLGAKLVLVHVADSSNPGRSGPRLPFNPATYRSGALERGAILLQECVGPALTDGARGRVELGDPVRGLVNAATDENASLLVLGWRGRRLFGGRLIGRLMRRSPCPVVLVRAPAQG
jgi:nucleotide-binding universal stress UspA family protein